jgi:hypothetical protein
MSDYAAAPIQPIVEGFITFPGGSGGPIVFLGKGVSQVTRDALTGGVGSYVLLLDTGLPGNAGAVPAANAPLPTPDPDVRTLVTPLGVGAPPSSGVAFIGVSYNPAAGPGIGARSVEIVLQAPGGAFIDPVGGVYVVVWRGLGGGPVL